MHNSQIHRSPKKVADGGTTAALLALAFLRWPTCGGGYERKGPPEDASVRTARVHAFIDAARALCKVLLY